MGATTVRRWWKEAVVYQIYPASFMDGNGDGIGDLGGIIGRLDYLQYVGVDTVWLCPIYESPQVDNGYDISDYYRIYSRFGTLEQFDELVEGLHSRGMKLIMDLVVNHTSDRHQWFLESKKSKDNPYRHYYIWRPSAPHTGAKSGGAPPNNWLSFFEGSAWRYHEATGEYYLHLFAPQQPDLNWENRALREEIYKMMRWWLDRGIDGFRMDVINLISKDPSFPDSEGKSSARILGGEYFINGPNVLRYLHEMRREVLDRYDVMTVGETPDVSPEEGLDYVNEEDGPLDMLFQFEHMDLDMGEEGYWSVGDWSLVEMKRILGNWQQKLQGSGWNSLYLNNHDQPRMVSRFGDDGEYRRESAKMLATLVHMLQGTPYIYQGEEIGMTNAAFPDISDYRDVATHNYFHRATEEEGKSIEEAMEVVRHRSRDNGRTPMQWDGSANAGFTDGSPWIAVQSNHREVNVEREIADPDSILHYYRRLIAIRRERPTVVYGGYEDLLPEDEALYLFRRIGEEEILYVFLNFSARTRRVPDHAIRPADGGTLVIANYADAAQRLSVVVYGEREGADIGCALRPFEARVYATDSP
ncbi:MAG: alpha-glucosidase [Spirochaetaceae bacterium]